MRLDPKALALTAALFWGGTFLIVGTIHLFEPSYGEAFLLLGKSIYPAYSMSGTVSSVLVVTLWSVADGLIGGLLFAWIYNWIRGIQ